MEFGYRIFTVMMDDKPVKSFTALSPAKLFFNQVSKFRNAKLLMETEKGVVILYVS